MNLIKQKKILVSAIALATTGCASYQQTVQESNQSRESITSETERQYEKLNNRKKVSNFQVVDDFFLADSSRPIEYREPLPDMKITISSRNSMSMHQILERIRAETGIPMRVTANLGDSEVDFDDVQIDDFTMLPILPLNRESGFVMNHDGSLEEALNKVASQFDLYWKYEDGQVVFYRYIVKAFDIDALPGEAQTNSNLQGGSGSFGADGDAGGGGSSNTQLTTSTSIWQSLENNISAMLTEDGNVVVSEATGKIIIKDRPHAMESIEKYIRAENKDLRKQVMVNIKVLSINKNRTAGQDVNWEAISGSLSSDFNFGLSAGGAMNLGSGAAVVSGTVVDGNAFEGSEAVFRAINQHTETSLMTNVFVSTLNNQPAPLQVVKRQAYIRSSGTTVTDTSTTTNIEQGTVNTGFSISLLPKIMRDDNILLQYSINLSDLQNLDTVSSGEQVVQTPEIDTRDFLQRISIKSGETLVISGFERVVSSYERRIGGRSNSIDNDMIVIIMTPVIVGR
jgi:type IVB pilus formation R64 PilN family outer membrane protein